MQVQHVALKEMCDCDVRQTDNIVSCSYEWTNNFLPCALLLQFNHSLRRLATATATSTPTATSSAV